MNPLRRRIPGSQGEHNGEVGDPDVPDDSHEGIDGSSADDDPGVDEASAHREVEGVTAPSYKRIPKKRRFDFGDDLDALEGGTVTLVNTDEPVPLDFVSDLHISRSTCLSFFQKLKLWRRNTGNHGTRGTVHRNTLFLSGDVKGWLSNMAGDPAANPSRQD